MALMPSQCPQRLPSPRSLLIIALPNQVSQTQRGRHGKGRRGSKPGFGRVASDERERRGQAKAGGGTHQDHEKRVRRDNVHPTPYTLHPAPYTLHPTPYTLHPGPSHQGSGPQSPTSPPSPTTLETLALGQRTPPHPLYASLLFPFFRLCLFPSRTHCGPSFIFRTVI